MRIVLKVVYGLLALFALPLIMGLHNGGFDPPHVSQGIPAKSLEQRWREADSNFHSLSDLLPTSVVQTLDFPSVSALQTAAVEFVVEGVNTADDASPVGVVCTPPAAMATAGLRLEHCYAKEADTVIIIVTNPGGAPVNLGPEPFAFWFLKYNP